MNLETVADINRHIGFGALKFSDLNVFAVFVKSPFQFADGIIPFAAVGEIGIGIAGYIFPVAFDLQYILAFIATPPRKRGAFVDELTLPLPGEILGPGDGDRGVARIDVIKADLHAGALDVGTVQRQHGQRPGPLDLLDRGPGDHDLLRLRRQGRGQRHAAAEGQGQAAAEFGVLVLHRNSSL